MNHQILKNIGRWFFAVVVGYTSLIGTAFALMLPGVLFLQICIRGADMAHPRMPIDIYIAFVKLLTSGACIAVWTIPSALAVGYALHMPVRTRWRWGLSGCLLITAAFEWFAPSAASTFASHFFMIASGLVLIVGVVVSLCYPSGRYLHLIANCAALFVLTLPCWIAFTLTPSSPPTARKLWSVVLQKNTWLAMNMGYSSLATQRAVFAGDRILAVFDAGFPKYEGEQPISTYRLVSLDLKTGSIRNFTEFAGHWGSMPSLYASDDGHAILYDPYNGSLTSLSPDLTPASPQFTPGSGRAYRISPDGSTLAWDTQPGITLFDSHNLKPLGKRIDVDVSFPSSVSTDSVVRDVHDNYSRDKYPND